MRLLIDTHVFLWFMTNDQQLSQLALDLIAKRENKLYLSAASIWEIAIKVSTGKLTLEAPFSDIFPREIERNNVDLLQITIPHLEQVSRLPFHHRDPFDRVITAQALTDELPLISADPAFDSYGVTRLWK